MATWKEFKIIKCHGGSTGNARYELDKTLVFLNGTTSNEVWTSSQVTEWFFKGESVEIDIDKVKSLRANNVNDELGKGDIRRKEIKRKVTVDGKEITIDEYNKLYYNEEHPLLVELSELYNEIYGSKGIGNREEYEKSNKVDRNLFTQIENDYKEYSREKGQSFPQIIGIDSQDNINKNTEKVEKGMKKVQRLVNEMRVMKANREEYSPDQSYEDKKEEANKLRQLIDKAVEEINKALNENPQITSEELEPDNRNWEDIEHAKSEKIINDIKSRVLADISAKRGIKQGKRKREDEENDNPNKKPKVGNEEKDGWDALKNSTLEGVEDNTIATGLKLATRLEGEEEFKNKEDVKKGEEELIKRNPQLYIDTIIEALQERINDNGVGMKLSEETKKLMRNEITDINEFKEAKDRAIKEIGEKGAKSRWSSFFNQAQALLTKAKSNVTEQIKKDIKKIQEQMKGFKAGTNSYLSSIYQQNKSEAEKLEKALDNISTNQTGEPKETPWGIIIPVSLVALSLIGIVAVVIVRRKRNQNKDKSIVE